MIQALYKLGSVLDGREKYRKYFATYASPFISRNRKGEDIVLYFPIVNGRIEEMKRTGYDPDDDWKYLFRKPKGARGAPLVATGPFYPVGDLADEKKRATQTENVAKIISRLERTIPEGDETYFPNTEARRAGLNKVSELLNDFEGTGKNRYIYTFRIEGRWPGEIKSLVALLEREAYAKYYEKSRGEDKVCAITYESAPEVYGRVDTLGFTVNERSFNRSGFDAKTSYRMFPVSPDATKRLEAARRFVFNRLNTRVHPLEFVVVPHLIMDDPERLLEAIEELSEEGGTLQSESYLLSDTGYIERIDGNDKLSRIDNLYDFLFYQRNNAQLALELYVQDVSGGRIVRIKDAQRTVNARYGRAFRTGKSGQRQHFVFDLRKTMKFFYLEGYGVNQRLLSSYPTLLEAIFHGTPYREAHFLERAMALIRKGFKNRQSGDSYWELNTQSAIASWFYLAQLNLFDHITPLPMAEANEKETLLSIHDYLAKNQQFFGRSELLKGAFLMGVLTGMLTYAQYKAIKSKPFLEKLNGLNLDRDELRKLIRPLTDKILSYQKRNESKALLPYHTVNDLLFKATTALLVEDRTVNRDQLSFAFVTGMVVQQKVGANIGERKEREKVETTSGTDTSTPS